MVSGSKQRLLDFVQGKLNVIEARDQRRHLDSTRRMDQMRVRRDGRDLISFADNDYLGLSQDPRVKRAACDAVLEQGAGAGASRLITGNGPLNTAVETKLSAMKGTEAALLFGSGYLANLSTISALMTTGDLIVMDELSHNCMFMGARLSGAKVLTFKHNDVDDARAKLRSHDAHKKLVLSESVFSMDGDLAPLNKLSKLCEEENAWLMTDDAHGLGILKDKSPALIQMGTLSKAVGAYGGYICGPQILIDFLINRARGLVFTTGLPPGVLAAALKALHIMEEEPDRRTRVLQNAARFCAGLGLPAPQSAIVPVILGTEARALKASQRLFEEGFLVTAIRPPTVAEGTSRLRFAFSSEHNEKDIDHLIMVMKSLLDTA